MLGTMFAEQLRCADVMRSPAARASPEHTVEAVARTMRDLGLGFLPVCDTTGRVLGIVTDRDITIRVCAEGRSPAETRVNAIMSRDVVCCRAEDPVTRAEELMTCHLKLRLVVIDDEDRLTGIISLTDLAKCLQPTRAAAILRQVSARGLRPVLRVPKHPNGMTARASHERDADR